MYDNDIQSHQSNNDSDPGGCEEEEEDDDDDGVDDDGDDDYDDDAMSTKYALTKRESSVLMLVGAKCSFCFNVVSINRVIAK